MNHASTLSDEEIVILVRDHDQEMYAEIIKRYQTKLIRYATYLLNDDQLGADAVQQGFIKAYINLRGFNVNKKFSSWIYRIIHNEAMNILGKHKHQLTIDDKIDFDSGINIEDNYIKTELMRRTHHCLNKMPLIYKEPLSLYFLEEKTYEEISDILRLPIGTVGTRINRAKLLMKKLCQE